jgi:hypothetical protein
MKRITVKEVDGILHVRLGKFLLKMKPHVNVNGFFKLNEIHHAIKITLYSPKGKKWENLAPSQWYRPDPSIPLKMFLDSMVVEGEPYPIDVIEHGGYKGVYGTQQVIERYVQWINESRIYIANGHIYIFHVEKFNQCKIGYTRTANKRLRVVTTAIGIEPMVIYKSVKLANAYDAEQLAHRWVGKSFKRLKGEWFEVNPCDIDEVITIVSSVVERIGVKDDNF